MLNFLRPVRFEEGVVTALTATGGITLAGSATISITALPLAVTGTGGITLGGTADATSAILISGSSGITLGGTGTATATALTALTGSSGITLGGTGTATATALAALTGTGGITLGGTATATATTFIALTATGNIYLGGTATQWGTSVITITALTGTGSLALGGTATATATTFTALTGTGSLALGGTATATATTFTALTATGSLALGGTATATVSTPMTNSYSMLLDGSNDIFRTRLLLHNYDGAGTGFFEDAISISFFFRLDTVDTNATGRYFYYLDNGGNNALGCYYTPSTGKISVKFGNAWYHTADLSLVADTWYHLCLSTERTSYNHSYLRYHEWELYLDGTSIKSVTGNTAVIRYDGYGVKGTLDGAVTDTDTTFTIDAANGPTSWQGNLDPRIAYIGDEQVLVSANVTNSSTSLSVTRAQNGTTATAHSDGAVITYSRDELVFGARYHTWPYLYYVDGQMDEIAVWNDTLTAAEVGTLKDGPIALTSDSGYYASSANLQAWWRFEENTGTSIADSSTKSNTGTLVNGATFSSSLP